MTPRVAILGIDVGELVEDAIRALVDLIIPDFAADWVSRLVTWLVALPPVTGGAFPSLRTYAAQLTAVGYGILAACFIAGLLQLWAGGLGGTARAAESVKRAAIGAGALACYPVVLQHVLLAVNVLTAEMVRHPLVQDGLDKAFGEAFVLAAVTGGVSLGLAVGAAVVLLFFVAALFVLKIGLTALLAVALIGGALVWGLYPLPQTDWLARTWLASIVAALAVPIAWACIFAAAALLARDTLVFDGGSGFNKPLGDTLAYLVKPFAAVACFWLAYRAPYFLLAVARTAGLNRAMLAPSSGASGSGTASGRGPEAIGCRGVQRHADRFRALAQGAQAASSVRTPQIRRGARAVVGRTSAVGRTVGSPPAAAGRTTAHDALREKAKGDAARQGAVARAVRAPRRANDWWRMLPDQGGPLRRAAARPSVRKPRSVRPDTGSPLERPADAARGKSPLPSVGAPRPTQPRAPAGGGQVANSTSVPSAPARLTQTHPRRSTPPAKPASTPPAPRWSGATPKISNPRPTAHRVKHK